MLLGRKGKRDMWNQVINLIDSKILPYKQLHLKLLFVDLREIENYVE